MTAGTKPRNAGSTNSSTAWGALPSLRIAQRSTSTSGAKPPSFRKFLSAVRVRNDDPLNPQLAPLKAWPRQLELADALEDGESVVLLKERQIGITTLIAAYLYWRAVHHGWNCGYYSVGQREAREQIARIKVMHEMLPPELAGNVSFTADDMRCPAGGGIVAFPSTEQAGISYTLQVAVMDEAAFHPYGQANYAALKPAAKQMVIQSTANPRLGPSGFFHNMYWASKRGESPYRSMFFGRFSRPDRTAEWYAREQAAYTGMPEDFDAYYPETDAAAFVARSGLVYPMFREDIHVKVSPVAWGDFKWRVAGVDPGGGDPTAIIPWGITGNNHVHQPDEFYKRGAVPVRDMGAYLLPLHIQAPFSAVLVDPSQASVIAELQAIGLPAMPADNRRGEGLGFMASLLEEERYTVDAKCKNTISEFYTYRWIDRVDPTSKDRYATSTPHENHGDAMDGGRYNGLFVQRIWRTSGPVTTHRAPSGYRKATHAV